MLNQRRPKSANAPTAPAIPAVVRKPPRPVRLHAAASRSKAGAAGPDRIWAGATLDVVVEAAVADKDMVQWNTLSVPHLDWASL